MDWIIRNKKWLFAIIVAGCLAAWFERWRGRNEDRYDAQIVAAAQRYKVPPALVKAMIWRESRFDALATGTSGEIGLMQVCEPAAREWAASEKLRGFSHRELFDPGKNTLAGTWYLSRALARYRRTDNPIPYALAEYNAGRSNVQRWNRGEAATNSAVFLAQMDFPGTRGYIETIMERLGRYQKRFDHNGRKL